MFSRQPVHYETGTFKEKSVFLPDEDYAKALDCLVKGCCDILIVRTGQGEMSSSGLESTGQIKSSFRDEGETDRVVEGMEVLLGKRKVYPQKDWWYPCGGRMKTGENPLQAAQRIFKRELDLDIKSPSIPTEQRLCTSKERSEEDTCHRFELVGYYSYVWELRNQQPQGHGTADISCVLSIALTAEEIEAIIPNTEEYEQHKWVPLKELLMPSQGAETYHPALQQSAKDYLDRKEWKAIVAEVLEERAVEGQGGSSEAENTYQLSDAEAGKRFRSFLQRTA